ncbi:MAG TPA: hypothetical protein VFM85_05520 [Actinomycetota bacterium]|nr:hypothetical protein [Actinomycetota bacterium]
MPDVVTIGESLHHRTAPVGEGLEQAGVRHLDVAGAESYLAIGLSRLGVSSVDLLFCTNPLIGAMARGCPLTPVGSNRILLFYHLTNGSTIWKSSRHRRHPGL